MSSLNRFFKVILHSTLHDHKLKIPDKFVNKYGDKLSDLVRLMVPTGVIWYVQLEKTQKTIWFHEGMHKFLEELSIRFGYLLIFKYQGNSTFKVHIFNLSALEIDYPFSSDSARPDNVNQLPISDEEEDDGGYHENTGDDSDDDNSIEILDSFIDHPQSSEFASANKQSCGVSAERWKPSRCYLTRSKKHKVQDDGRIEITGTHDSAPPRRNKVYPSKGSMHKATADEAALVSSSKSNRNITSRKTLVKVQKNRAIRAANMALPKNPSYAITLKAYNFCSNLMNFPKEFTRLYLPYRSQFIKLQDIDNNEWEVYCICREGRGCYLSKGWAKFRTEKNLKKGDVCVFEPIRINEEVKLKVRTSRDTIKHA